MANGGMTTIQVSSSLLNMLKVRKLSDKESYERIILDLLEDASEISKETKRELAASRAEAAAGRVVPFAEVKKRAGLD